MLIALGPTRRSASRHPSQFLSLSPPRPPPPALAHLGLGLRQVDGPLIQGAHGVQRAHHLRRGEAGRGGKRRGARLAPRLQWWERWGHSNGRRGEKDQARRRRFPSPGGGAAYLGQVRLADDDDLGFVVLMILAPRGVDPVARVVALALGEGSGGGRVREGGEPRRLRLCGGRAPAAMLVPPPPPCQPPAP